MGENPWDKITDSCVANALRAGFMNKKCSFNQTAAAAQKIEANNSKGKGSHKKFGPEFRVW